MVHFGMNSTMESCMWSVVAPRLECRTLHRENTGSNPLVAVSFMSLHVATVHSAVK